MKTNEINRQVIESDQHADTFLSICVNGHVYVRLYSIRCQEARQDDAPNQDYARVVFTSDRTSLSFCVCDGVGGSYLGDFAARYLSIRLTDALLDLPKIPRNPYRTAVALQKNLETWTAEAQSALRDVAIQSSLSPLEQEIIMEQREQYGSSTVFFCGRVDGFHPHATAQEDDPLPALFGWMGNVTARAFFSHQDIQILGHLDDDRNRWSTRTGQQGKLSMCTCKLSRTEPLLVYTDGLEPLAHQLATLDDTGLQRQIQHLLRQPASDDMTLLDLRWQETGT